VGRSIVPLRYHRYVSERGLPVAEGAHACPFVAFEDDRDERATVPDHRHRCYAEVRPAPRALAHQEAYCLSSAFPVCPTFQDWARRESARARDAADAAAESAAAESAAERRSESSSAEGGADEAAAGATAEPGGAAAAAGGAAAGGAAAAAMSDPGGDLAADPPRPEDLDDGPRRNPPRDWSAPPPWLASAENADHDPNSEPPTFLARRADPGAGLAGSPADRLAGGPPPRPAPTSTQAAASIDHVREHVPDPSLGDDDRPPVAAPPRRPRAYEQHLGGPSTGPDWERPRRYEAYPAIRTRIGIPALPTGPLAIGVLAVVIAALALFFLPAILGLGSGDQATTSPSPSVAPSESLAPTPIPAPTPIIYTIKKGETLSKIATAHGITIEQLMAANPEIKNPDRISEGQKITIPVPEAPDEFGSPSPSAEASP
jgi:hypothetical protein